MPNLITELEARGFARHNTGGNCVAYIRTNVDGSSEWVTANDGSGSPDPDDWAWVKYDTDNRTVEGEVLDCADSECSPVDVITLIDMGA